MKKHFILPSLALATMGFFAFQTTEKGMVEAYKVKEHLFPGGNQPGLTGAPNEGNCTQCHTGSTQDGSAENLFELRDGSSNVVTSYVPGESYTVALSMASDPSKKGFSSTVLDGSNTLAGSFTGISGGGTQDFSNSGKDYVSHFNSPSSNTNANSEWTWTWVAPATDVGTVTFYVASNAADGNSNTAGDVIYLSQHPITSSLGVDEQELAAANFTTGYVNASHQVTVNFNSLVANDMFFNLLDLNGKSVYTYKLDKSMIGENQEVIALPQEIENGMYIVNFFVGNKAMSGKIMVQR